MWLQGVAVSPKMIGNTTEVGEPMSDKVKNDRGLKTRRNLSNAIDIKLWNELHILSKESRVPKSRLLDEAVELLLKKHGRL